MWRNYVAAWARMGIRRPPDVEVLWESEGSREHLGEDLARWALSAVDLSSGFLRLCVKVAAEQARCTERILRMNRSHVVVEPCLVEGLVPVMGVGDLVSRSAAKPCRLPMMFCGEALQATYDVIRPLAEGFYSSYVPD